MCDYVGIAPYILRLHTKCR